MESVYLNPHTTFCMGKRNLRLRSPITTPSLVAILRTVAHKILRLNCYISCQQSDPVALTPTEKWVSAISSLFSHFCVRPHQNFHDFRGPQLRDHEGWRVARGLIRYVSLPYTLSPIQSLSPDARPWSFELVPFVEGFRGKVARAQIWHQLGASSKINRNKG